jgi:hypothetical protein
MVAQLLGWNSKFHYRVHKSPSLDPALNQLNSVHMLTSDFSKNYSNIILPYTLGRQVDSSSNSYSLCLSYPWDRKFWVVYPYSFAVTRRHQLWFFLFRILSCLVQCTNCSVTRSPPSPPPVVVASVKQVTLGNSRIPQVLNCIVFIALHVLYGATLLFCTNMHNIFFKTFFARSDRKQEQKCT